MQKNIVLASSSKYRQQILKKLHIPFSCQSPQIDETPKDGETAEQLVERLAIAKAQALASSFPCHLIIGSDQVCTLDGNIVGKPHSATVARQQLIRASGKTIRFVTGLALYDSETGSVSSLVEPFDVSFRTLDEAIIERYLAVEKPFDCAGSFKSEGAGIVLFDALYGRDPNTLVGLPLIALYQLLEAQGIELLTE
ncbi:Maf family protein [Celerinatantimonas sp. YJH-8]|uniref:Maf family protein n=1 Tax=Celerinatantimonas sp. YJH-8 TaxID=3228714 RepID=UPI0038C8B286